MSRNNSGAVDSVRGLQRQHGERVTKAEFQDTRAAALSRLQKSAQVISMQAFDDLALIYAMNTQQFMSTETYIRTAGRWEETLRQEYGVVEDFHRVTPFDLDIAFDILSHDGSIEANHDAESWIQLFQYSLANPVLLQTVDFTRVWLHIARLLGEKNAHEFLLKERPVKPTVQPDEAVYSQAAIGAVRAIP